MFQQSISVVDLATELVQIFKYTFFLQLQINAEGWMWNPDTLDSGDGRFQRPYLTPSEQLSLDTPTGPHWTTVNWMNMCWIMMDIGMVSKAANTTLPAWYMYLKTNILPMCGGLSRS